MKKPSIYVVSGAKGTSGDRITRTALAQFEGKKVPVIIVPFVKDVRQLEEVVEEVANSGGVIVHTLVNTALRTTLIELARQRQVDAVDFMGPLLAVLARLLEQEPLGQPGLYRQLQEDYFKRIEAIEFTVEHDDGKRADDLHLAEIVLTGVSRVGKTPLSMYLSVQGWMVANIPVVVGVTPPEKLFDIDPRRVVGLTISPGQLAAFRRHRQERFGLSNRREYASAQKLYEEIEFAEKLFRRSGFAVLDITDRPIEESAEKVISIVNRRLQS